MSVRSHAPRCLAIAAALTLAAAQAARADSSTTTSSITISGSTAFKGFFQSPGSTNDYIDVNGDGIFDFNGTTGGSGPTDPPLVQQLAPNVTITNGSVASYLTGANINGASNVALWSVQYRGVGSVNGLNELVNYALNGAIPNTQNADPGYLNRTQVSAAGTSSFTGPGGFPIATPMNSVDAAVLDVTIPWGVQGVAGSAVWNAKPTQAGYGTNAALPINGSSQTNQLASLTSGNKSLNLNTASPNGSTVFGTPMAFAPISIVSNHGTGLQNVTQTQLQVLYVTGRMPDGTNLVGATRDIGSGTRNGAMNSINVDPSFGVGENIGSITTNANVQAVLGANFQPTNLDATGTMEKVLTNDRLAIGYISTTNGKSDQASGAIETLGVQFNLEGGTDFVRPTASTIINNDTNGAAGTGYRIGGIETFATVGDPLATAINANYPAINGTDPQMSNLAAAAYIRNIYESVKNYTANPNAVTNTFMPVQSLVSSNFIPIGGLTDVQSSFDGTSWVSNSALASSVHTAAAGITGLNTGAYGSGSNANGAAAYGLVPIRQNLTSGTYSDGQTISYRYFDNTGALFTIAGGQNLNQRNAIAGDFNGDGQRNINDINDLVGAAINTPAWAQAHNSGNGGAGLGNAAIPEILGDFNGDGNYDKSDVRYFADGLAIDPGTGLLNRKTGFTMVDNAASGNFFATTLATPKTYAAGDSRGDIAGSITGPSAGGAPTGSDGTINVKDIDYEMSQIKAATGQTSIKPTSGTNPNLDVNGAFSTLLTRGAANPLVNVRADLSADMTGDLSINKSDLDELVQTILGTQYGDANLDGKVTGADYTNWADNFGKAGGWAAGDFNGDGQITGADYTIWADNFGFGTGGSPTVRLGSTSAVPEPASFGLLGLSAVILLRRRRK